MNREILFRGKRADNGAWETGSRVAERMGTSEERIFIADKMTGYHTPIIPSTAGQYTGLTDKNGVKIFECDVLRFRSGDYVVKWCNGHSKFLQVSKSFSRELYICIKESEVIGNIHDNPELLEGEPNV